jgi:hypothetical protein
VDDRHPDGLQLLRPQLPPFPGVSLRRAGPSPLFVPGDTVLCRLLLIVTSCFPPPLSLYESALFKINPELKGELLYLLCFKAQKEESRMNDFLALRTDLNILTIPSFLGNMRPSLPFFHRLFNQTLHAHRKESSLESRRIPMVRGGPVIRRNPGSALFRSQNDGRGQKC